MTNKTVKEIIIEWLKEHGYDGLCGCDCGCGIDDFAPCESISLSCEAGYKIKPSVDSEWYGETDWIYVPSEERADAKI